MIGKWGFSLLPFYLGIIPIFANNNYTLTSNSAEEHIVFPGKGGGKGREEGARAVHLSFWEKDSVVKSICLEYNTSRLIGNST